jgi:hypothetical protein
MMSYKEIPDSQVSAFTMNGQVPVVVDYHEEANSSQLVWGLQYCEEFLEAFSSKSSMLKKDFMEPYPGSALMLFEVLKTLRVSEKKIAVVGSLSPWIEAMVLNLGANNVTTVEYNPPHSEHPAIHPMSFDEFRISSTKFDLIISFSSLEHSGLGRYGEDLHPDGDLEAMQVIRESLCDEGAFVWGGPVGNDTLVWNAHRIYGKLRLPYLFKDFRVINRYNPSGVGIIRLKIVIYGLFQKLSSGRWGRNCFYQPVFLLKRV